MTAPVGRFAPSPTGRIHAGNIFAYLIAWLSVKAQGGRMVLRIEDLDPERSKPELADAVQRDLEALGLTWDEGPFHQHDRADAYAEAYERVAEALPVYPCFCTRADLSALSAPHLGEKRVYPGTCRALSPAQVEERMRRGDEPAWRAAVPDQIIGFEDAFQGWHEQHLAKECGDFIIRRKDGAFAYQLAVVVDDAAQGVTSVVRGVDLLSSTPQQMLLQRALGYPTPSYGHVPLIVNECGRRLSKRDEDASLDEMLKRFGSPQAVIGHIAFKGGLLSEDEPASPVELLSVYDEARLKERYQGCISIPF